MHDSSRRCSPGAIVIAGLLATLGLPVRSAEHGPTVPFDSAWVPAPVFDAHPGYVDMYWKAWKLAWEHVHWDSAAPASPFMDEAFADGTIWIWDTEFMALFCKYAPERFPGVESFDNFWKPMHDGVPSSQKIHHPDNPPFFAWVEWQHLQFTGDTARIRRILSKENYLQRHFAWFDKTRGTHPRGYSWSGNPSGMDNTPRGRNCGGHFGMLWMDAISQQALSAFYIARLADVRGNSAVRDSFDGIFTRLKNTINTHYWSDEGYYTDLSADKAARKCNVVTPATFWPMLAGVADTLQAARLLSLVQTPTLLGGRVAFPSLARSDQAFDCSGRYWQGGVWLPLVYMAVKAMERYAMGDKADMAAWSVVDHMYRTYRDYGDAPTIWECYSPTRPEPATGKNGAVVVRPDFCGWSALGPISLLIENVIGFHDVSALENRVHWRLHHPCRHGIRRLRFGSTVTDLLYEQGKIRTTSNSPYVLVVNDVAYEVPAGTATISVPAPVPISLPEPPPSPPNKAREAAVNSSPPLESSESVTDGFLTTGRRLEGILPDTTSLRWPELVSIDSLFVFTPCITGRTIQYRTDSTWLIADSSSGAHREIALPEAIRTGELRVICAAGDPECASIRELEVYSRDEWEAKMNPRGRRGRNRLRQNRPHRILAADYRAGNLLMLPRGVKGVVLYTIRGQKVWEYRRTRCSVPAKVRPLLAEAAMGMLVVRWIEQQGWFRGAVR